MKSQKKLKRGLADLSSFFAHPEPAGQKNRGRLTIEPPENSIPDPTSVPSLITASVFSFSESFGTSQLIDITESIKSSFSGVHIVTLTTQQNSFEYRILGQDINYEKISLNQLEPLIYPQIRATFCPPAFNDEKTLVVFDSDLTVHPSLFELLDHCIFAVESDTKQLMQAYQIMKMTLSRNPNLRYSLFLVGQGAERFSELVYERFSEIVSNFLGNNLGFLGWLENQNICINSDLLKEEADNAIAQYAKMNLSKLLYQPQLVSSNH